MNYQLLQMKIVKSILFCAVFGILLSTFVLKAQGQSVTFAQFLERAATQDFIFTNNSSSATFGTISGGVPIFFLYSNVVGLDSSLQGFQNAHLFVTTTTTMPATLDTMTNTLNQQFNQTTVITILRDTAAAPGIGTGIRRNLLTATISTNTATPSFTGTNTGNSGTFNVTTPDHVVTFSSDFVNFSLTTQRNLSLSFSSIQPTLALGSNNFLQSFSAAGSGTFASNPAPTVNVVTAASTTVGGRVTEATGRGIFRALVTLIDSQGVERVAYTNPQGYYSFPDVPGGQTYIFSVRHLRYAFAEPSLVEFVDEDNPNINFVSSGENLLRPAIRSLDQ